MNDIDADQKTNYQSFVQDEWAPVVFNISNVLRKHNDLHERNIEAVLEKELLIVQAYAVA